MNLISRTKNILLSPKQEWQVIDDEATSVGGLYLGYIVPLAAIGPIASSIRMALFGISVPSMGTYRVPIGAAVRQGIAQYVMALVGVFVLALIIDELAPYFRGQENRYQALKVAAVVQPVPPVSRPARPDESAAGKGHALFGRGDDFRRGAVLRDRNDRGATRRRAGDRGRESEGKFLKLHQGPEGPGWALTVKSVEARTSPVSPTTSTLHLPADTALLLQVRVEG